MRQTARLMQRNKKRSTRTTYVRSKRSLRCYATEESSQKQQQQQPQHKKEGLERAEKTENAEGESLWYLGVPVGVLLTYAGLQNDFLASVQREEIGTALVFALGYTCIVFEEQLQLNKSAVALSTAVMMWTIRAAGNSEYVLSRDLSESVGNISQIIFFLLGAMSIVETIEAHSAFGVVTERISTSSRKALLWALSVLTFFLSAVLDNLTS